MWNTQGKHPNLNYFYKRWTCGLIMYTHLFLCRGTESTIFSIKVRANSIVNHVREVILMCVV